MSTNEVSKLEDAGCQEFTSRVYKWRSHFDPYVALIFGNATADSYPSFSTVEPAYTAYGASGYNGDANLTTVEIAAFTLLYVKGWSRCAVAPHDGQIVLHLTVGAVMSGSDVSAGHGAAWAEMISNIKTALLGNPTPVVVEAGFDIEPAYHTKSAVFDELQAFNARQASNYYNIGSAECGNYSGTYTLSMSCNNGWTTADLLRVSYFGYSTAYVWPQIYTHNTAIEWGKLSNLAKSSSGTGSQNVTSYGQYMPFSASLTKVSACATVPASQQGADCAQTSTNYWDQPDPSWTDISGQIAADDYIAGQSDIVHLMYLPGFASA